MGYYLFQDSMLLFFLATLAFLSLPVYPLVLKVVLSTTTRPTCSLSKLVGTSSLNLLDSTDSLDSHARWHLRGLVGGHYPAPRRPPSRPACSLLELVGTSFAF